MSSYHSGTALQFSPVYETTLMQTAANSASIATSTMAKYKASRIENERIIRTRLLARQARPASQEAGIYNETSTAASKQASNGCYGDPAVTRGLGTACLVLQLGHATERATLRLRWIEERRGKGEDPQPSKVLTVRSAGFCVHRSPTPVGSRSRRLPPSPSPPGRTRQSVLREGIQSFPRSIHCPCGNAKPEKKTREKRE